MARMPHTQPETKASRLSHTTASSIRGIQDPQVMDAPVGRGIMMEPRIRVRAQARPPMARFLALSFRPRHSQTVTAR